MTNANDHTHELLTVREVATALRVDDTTVRRWIKSGALTAVSLPHAGSRTAYRVHRAELTRIYAGVHNAHNQ